MKKILAVILCVISIFSLGGCSLFELKSCEDTRSDSLITTGDFVYKIEGKQTTNESARIIKLSEEGLTKKIIIIPEKIDQYIIKTVGDDPNALGYERDITIYGQYNKIYIPNTVVSIGKTVWPIDRQSLNEFVFNACSKIEFKGAEFFNQKQTENNPPNYVYLPSLEYLLSAKSYINIIAIKANLQYEYNIENVTKKHWIDNVDTGSKLTVPPTDPEQEGYTFGGWYKEKECINKWNFETDVTQTMIIEDGTEITEEMQEREDYATMLYAKWVAA